MSWRRVLGRIPSADLTVTAFDASGDRTSFKGRSYEIATSDGGLTLTVSEWRAVVAMVERDMVRDLVPLPARRRAKLARKRRH